MIIQIYFSIKCWLCEDYMVWSWSQSLWIYLQCKFYTYQYSWLFHKYLPDPAVCDSRPLYLTDWETFLKLFLLWLWLMKIPTQYKASILADEWWITDDANIMPIGQFQAIRGAAGWQEDAQCGGGGHKGCLQGGVGVQLLDLYGVLKFVTMLATVKVVGLLVLFGEVMVVVEM